ncbi:putative aryl-alcohol dehydrogenase AAD14 [Ceratocystis lukuohia]|uniref:Aryl-alcohol dehydrogenase AAD14 n=1 Tax=Ceratocystis lukuohia TaxID=2019550 RepID=A0ABR4MMN4_9PEZI
MSSQNESPFFGTAAPPPTELGRLRIMAANCSLRVSPLQLGAMSIGDAWKDFMGSMDKESSFKLLDAYVAAGGNVIDTASGYQNDQSEQWIGEWMQERGNRDKMIIATKFSMDYQAYRFGKGKTPNTSGNGRRSILLTLRDSLKKLQTDFVEIFYLHYWDFTASIKEIMDTLHALVESGKVMFLAISDTPAWIVAAANTYAIENGKTPFSIYQGRWNIGVRDVEREIVPVLRHFGMSFCAWDAMGGGQWQTKKQIEERRKNNEKMRSTFGNGIDQSPQDAAISEALEKVAAEVNAPNIQAVALAYLLAKGEQLKINVFPIVGGRKTEHLNGNISALSINLSDKQVEYLESVAPFKPEFPYSSFGSDPNIDPNGAFLLKQSGNYKFPLPFRP